ncbi:undecaprenyl-diphosphatase [Paraburkholderia rhynchosiae]|uniref:Undecaprenyl-diphosphatase n=1 Tax=Paraburkholderia rhynchosiae TaxID=487049 RepID=A0A2N7WVH0_9BURK|nr:undecaprenyl-diphosphatase [Paraburkholderia rhynchosiae]PMS33449.1 undecaprenyl-diphosphatase [Paraburkholderia rhynchosiae]CAB3682148.1 Undecaprenyl-diphosphatase BcrC [Paraburkholderia rhynchosiae]
MARFDYAFFLWLNAPEHPNTLAVKLAVVLAERLIWAIPLLIGICWLRGSGTTRRGMLVATASGMLGLLVSQVIGLAWPHPRPFMIGLGHTLIAHVADSSFPSDHLTLWWAVGFSLLRQRRTRSAGVALALLGAPIAWARIYLGVHFPLDMLGAAVVAALSAWLTWREARWYLRPIFRLASGIHRSFLGRLIARGWVRE